MPEPLDVDRLEELFLPACAPHQIADVSGVCVCRTRDPRWAIFDLIAEVRELRGQLRELED
jgi:hypothetical protein